MTRTEFIEAYAKRSNLNSRWAGIGVVEIGDAVLFALPCGCNEPGCEGWAMLSGDSVIGHLFFQAPDELKSAYRKAVQEAGGE